MQSFIVKKVRGRWKCFKRCSVTKRLPNIMTILRLFRHSIFPKSRQRACKKSSISRQKQGTDLQPFQIFKTTRSAFFFKLGISISVESFKSNFIVRRYLKYSCLEGHAFLFDLREKFNSFEIPLQGTLIPNS